MAFPYNRTPVHISPSLVTRCGSGWPSILQAHWMFDIQTSIAQPRPLKQPVATGTWRVGPVRNFSTTSSVTESIDVYVRLAHTLTIGHKDCAQTAHVLLNLLGCCVCCSGRRSMVP